MVRGKGLKYDSFMLTGRWAYNRRGASALLHTAIGKGGGEMKGGL